MVWFDENIIEGTEVALDRATKWRWIYENGRPNQGIGGITPVMKPKVVV